MLQKYQSQLKKLPGAWGATDKAVGSTGDKFAEMTAALMAQAELQKKALSDQKKMGRACKERRADGTVRVRMHSAVHSRTETRSTMNPLSSDEVKRLSPQDRLALVEQLWDSTKDADVPVTEAQAAEIERRLADPVDRAHGVTWDQLKAELSQRRS